MKPYRFDEHGVGYRFKKTLQPWRPQFPVILSWVPVKARVLDMGCGDGVLGEWLIKKKKCTVYGIDLDTQGVREARRRGIKAQVHDADEKLHFQKNQFDIVICSDLLQHVKKPDFVMSEVLRVGKSAIVQFPNFGFWFYRLFLLLGRFPRLALYGHDWWESQLTRHFSYQDFLSLPSIQNVQIKKLSGIDWKNRNRSLLARIFPNFFARSVIVQLEKIE